MVVRGESRRCEKVRRGPIHCWSQARGQSRHFWLMRARQKGGLLTGEGYGRLQWYSKDRRRIAWLTRGITRIYMSKKPRSNQYRTRLPSPPSTTSSCPRHPSAASSAARRNRCRSRTCRPARLALPLFLSNCSPSSTRGPAYSASY